MTSDRPQVINDSRYSVKTAATKLGVSRSTIYRAALSGCIPFVLGRNGRKIFYGRDLVAFWSANF